MEDGVIGPGCRFTVEPLLEFTLGGVEFLFGLFHHGLQHRRFGLALTHTATPSFRIFHPKGYP